MFIGRKSCVILIFLLILRVKHVSMGGLEEIIVPMVIAGIVFFSIFAEIRNQAKLRANNAPKQKPAPLQKPIIIEAEEKLPQEEKKRKVVPNLQLQGDVTVPSPVKDVAYETDKDSEAGDAMEDIRRAVIAHEILKRKF